VRKIEPDAAKQGDAAAIKGGAIIDHETPNKRRFAAVEK
jgi:hypothetical protein